MLNTGCPEMPTTQLRIRLPDDLVRRFRRSVSLRHRSEFIQRLLEEALPPDNGSDDDSLYLAALAVEKEHELATEMAEWEAAMIDDGLGHGDPWEKRR
jgi:metal-responsive CopG/Arc/MetJ family transcriptional regulator